MKIRPLIAAILALSASPVLAMNVTVTQRNGDVIIRGDDLPDSLLIQSPFDGVLVIRGRNTGPFGMWPTLVNGSSSPLVVDIVDDLRIDLAGGDDTLDIRDPYMYRTSHSALIVEMGSGDDEVDVRDVVLSGLCRVDMGSGNDLLEVFDSVAMEMQFWQRGESGLFNLYGLNCQDFTIESGSGNDVAYVYSVSTTLMEVFLGAGNDKLYLKDIHAMPGSLLDGGLGYDAFNGPTPRWYLAGYTGFEQKRLSYLFGF